MLFPVSLEENRTRVLPYRSYSLDLTSYNILYNYFTKEAQSGRRFDSRHDVKNTVFQCINSILK